VFYGHGKLFVVLALLFMNQVNNDHHRRPLAQEGDVGPDRSRANARHQPPPAKNEKKRNRLPGDGWMTLLTPGLPQGLFSSEPFILSPSRNSFSRRTPEG